MKALIATLSVLLFITLMGCINGKANIKEEQVEKAYENIEIDEVKGNWINIHNPSELLTLGENQKFELREVYWQKEEIAKPGFNRPQIRVLRGDWETNGYNTLILKNILTLDSSPSILSANYIELSGLIERNKKGDLRIIALRPPRSVLFNGEIWVKD